MRLGSPLKPNKEINIECWGFPEGLVVKNLPVDAGDMGSIPDLGRSHIPQSNHTCVPQLLSLYSGARKPQLVSPQLVSPPVTATEAHVP